MDGSSLKHTIFIHQKWRTKNTWTQFPTETFLIKHSLKATQNDRHENTATIIYK